MRLGGDSKICNSILEGEAQEVPRELQVPGQEVLADEAQVVLKGLWMKQGALAGENLGLHRVVMVR